LGEVELLWLPCDAELEGAVGEGEAVWADADEELGELEEEDDAGDPDGAAADCA
jgi:hypothetical protein